MARFKFVKKENTDKLPNTTGVYSFKKGADFLYIGKAINIKQRVKNHFNQPVFKDSIFLPQSDKIGFIETNSEIEALLLEAQLIKQYLPKYNSVWKDGKSHNFVYITKEDFPRVFIAHGTETLRLLPQGDSQMIGPFLEGLALKQTLRLLRKIFPFRTCKTLPKKACLYKELNLCLAPCNLKSQISNCKSKSKILNLKNEYKKNIQNLKAVLEGKSQAVLNGFKREMLMASKKQEFEKAKDLRDKVFALKKVFANAKVLQKEKGAELLFTKELGSFEGRIEGYDVSNIQGKQATGSMVVFKKGLPVKAEYKKFKIKTLKEPNDVGMLKEVLSRRFNHKEWPLPQVALIDGGIAQLRAGLNIKSKIANGKSKSKILNIKIMSLAKKNNELFIEGRKAPLFLKDLPQEISNLILRIRDEAHRFAITYHRKLRSKNLLQK